MAPGPPPSGKERLYRRHMLDGMEVFVHVSLMQTAPQVSLDYGGWWIFKRLKVHGLMPAAQACAASL